MALSVAARAQRRAAEVYECAIRGHLSAGDTKLALNSALAHLQSEMSKLRDRRAGDAAWMDAELAARVTILAASLHAHRPLRPPGAPRVPAADDLTRAFDAALLAAMEGHGDER